MSKPLFIRYDRKQAQKPNWVGLKAARLARLYHYGLPVPPFVVIPAYTVQHLYSAQHAVRLRSDWLLFFRNWRRAFRESAKFAVRSSGISEDSSSYSFAGQFESVLHLIDDNDIWAAIHRCVLSAQDIGARAYIGQSADTPSPPAVMIQLLIPAAYSGVLFTQHPVTGQAGMMLEYVEGLADRLTAGQENPFRCFLDLSSQIIGTESSFHAETLPARLSVHLEKLLRYAHDIERRFIVPQDIEWAIAQDKLWIVQARPITTTAANEHLVFDARHKPYTDFFFVERFSSPPSPMGWSLLKPIIEKNAFREPLWFLGYDRWVKAKQVTRIFSGYPYTALKVMQALYSAIPLRFISRDKKNQLQLHTRLTPWWVSLLRSIPFLYTRLFSKNLQWLPFFHLHKWNIFYQQCKNEIKEINEARLEAAGFPSWYALLNRTMALSDEFLSLHRWSITFADLYYELLLKYIKLQRPTFEATTMMHELLSGLAENQTVLANRYLARLAGLPGRPDDHPELWQRFFKQFGHRSESLDIAVPTWDEKRDTIDSLVQHLAQDFQAQEKSSLSHAQQKRELAHKDCFAHINRRTGLVPAFVHRALFQYLVSRGQIFALLRENQRDIWHRILAQSRQLVLAMADYAVALQWLQHRDDIFYLRVQEVPGLAVEKQRAQLLLLIASRRLATPTSAAAELEKTDRRDRNLFGLGVSHGIAVGKAFVAATYEEALTVPKNAILVTRAIDPAWTPVFHSIAGLVLEVGGVLSHASILAREFGVPTVTGVALASRKIASGTRIKVNGTNGLLTLLDEHDD